jgi:hypothetical protein
MRTRTTTIDLPVLHLAEIAVYFRWGRRSLPRAAWVKGSISFIARRRRIRPAPGPGKNDDMPDSE